MIGNCYKICTSQTIFYSRFLGCTTRGLLSTDSVRTVSKIFAFNTSTTPEATALDAERRLTATMSGSISKECEKEELHKGSDRVADDVENGRETEQIMERKTLR